MHGPLLIDALRSLWIVDDGARRRRTLSRLAQHKRQLETWWKCELGAHLWDYVDRFGEGTYAWLEALDRADVTIATGKESSKGLAIDPSGAVCIPIELKTIGTWWGTSRSAIGKALDEPGKKRLSEDMHQLLERGRRTKPFGAVGLLVTHVGRASDEVFGRYLDFARNLGRGLALDVLLDETIELPAEGGQAVAAHQIFWITPGTTVESTDRVEHRDAASAARVHETITQHQRAWMSAKAYPTRASGWATILEHNLFQPLDPDVREELEEADGNELAGKLTAPWSSSALALNMFQFWCRGDRTLLARAIGRSDISAIHFERCHPTGNRHARANLDVEIESSSEPVLAIESKLREPFGHHAPLAPSYLEKTELWRQLPRCLEIAKACTREPGSFQRLDVPQLLKHILGLTRSRAPFELLYLWYDPSRLLTEHERGPVEQHARELDRFASEIAPEVRFRHMTYQQLFDRLRDANSDYVEYMHARYFA
jgi:hypothetical protein